MKYFIDTEFLEGPQQKRFFGIPFGKTKPTIDLISIGIVSEDGREYYAVSKDFNLKEAWNRFQWKDNLPDSLSHGKVKEYWIREKVLKPIYNELMLLLKEEQLLGYDKPSKVYLSNKFSYENLKLLIDWYGKTNKQIAEEVIEFVYGFAVTGYPQENTDKIIPKDIQFYAYYADYDWVVFCWLFGNMIDLPKGFPKYCRDLQQTSDEIYNEKKLDYEAGGGRNFIAKMSNHLDYPKQNSLKTHNALEDARWNKELYKFLNKL